MAKRKRKKKPPPGSTEPTGKMRPADGASGQPPDEGTRIDDGARHIFFSFKGELKSGQPEGTETDVAGNLGLPPPDETATSEPEAADETTPEPEDAAESAPADATPTDDPGAEATTADTELDRAVEPAPPPTPDRAEQDQSRAGPVRGPDPAASQKTASQSRKAAGPAHFIPPVEPPLGESQPAKPADAVPEEPPTHTDVRGEPFSPEPSADATRTEIDTGLFAPRTDDADDVPSDAATQTEFDARDLAPPAKPQQPAPPRPGKVASVGDESAVGSETMLDAGIASRPKPKEETAAGSETILDALSAKQPLAGAPREKAGDETAADAAGVREPDAETTRTHPDAAAQAGEGAGDRADATRSYTSPDADTVTKEPFSPKATRPTATDLPHALPAFPRPPAASPEATTDSLAGAPSGAEGYLPAAAPQGADADAPSFHDADTATQDLQPIADEVALPAPGLFDVAADETRSVTEPRPEVPTVEAHPATFAGALFEVPGPSVPEEAPPERVVRPRIRRRRKVRKPEEPALKRLVTWAKRRLDLRDFLEIVGTEVFERAQKVGEKLRTARRANRVSHTAEWWRKTLTELAILYAIVIPIELAVSGRLGSFGIHPHPYWLIVLPLAAARGLVAGMIAAAIASILYTIGATQAVADALFTFRNMTEPLLFFAVAFFAGELHDEGLLKRKKLERRIGDLDERTEQLRQQRDVLTDANRELEKRIVDDSVQFGNLIQAARRIERAGRQEIFDLALEMAEEHCGAAASVLILLEDGSIDYLCHRGWPSEEVGKRLAIARASAFVRRSVSEGVAVNGLDPSEVAPQEGPLVVAPLFDAGGVAKAIICLDEIPLARLNESTVTVFLGIADWASAALARITRAGDAPLPRTSALSVGPEVDLWLGTVPDLGRRLRIELARNSRYGIPTSFLTIQATEWKDATREGIDALDRFMLTHFTTGLRPSDGIYRFGYPGSYLLVLAGTTLQGAEVVRVRLERRISYAPSPFGAVEILATGPDTEAPDLASLVARVARKFRERTKLSLDARCPVSIADRLDAEDLNAFLRRLKMETSLAVRNGLDLHVVGIAAEASEQAGPGILARHVVEVGEQTLRPTDGVYMIGQYQCAIILPCTNGEEAATVAHRLATLVRARDPSAPYGQIETQVLGLGPVHPDAGSFLTALARRGKEASR